MATNNPQDRRRGFVNRLYAQYQQGQGAGRAAPGMGTPFHGGIRSAPAIHTQMTNFDNIGGGIRNALGVGGNSHFLPGDAGTPGSEVSMPHPSGMPLPSAVPLPLPGAGNGTPLPPSSPSSPATNFVDPNSVAGQQMASGTTLPAVGTPSGGNTSTTASGTPSVDPGFNSIPHDAVPLGGGIYWSPTNGIINLGATGANVGTLSGSLGASAKNVGTATPS